MAPMPRRARVEGSGTEFGEEPPEYSALPPPLLPIWSTEPAPQFCGPLMNIVPMPDFVSVLPAATVRGPSTLTSANTS